MENYNYPYGNLGTHKVKITLQSGTLKGEVITELGGNMGGAAILSSIASSLEDNDVEFPVTEDNKKLLTFEEGAVDGKHSYADTVTLRDGDLSKTFDISENSNKLKQLITSIEIISFEKE